MNLIQGGDARAALRRRADLAIGVSLGFAIGIVVIVVFVFVGSEGTIDAPRISGVDTGKPPAAKRAPAQTPRPFR